MIAKFENYLRGDLAGSGTIKSYIGAAHRFHRFIGVLPIEQVRPSHITEFRLTSQDRGIGGTSISQYLIGLRSYFKWLHREGIISEDYSLWPECHLKQKKAVTLRSARQAEHHKIPTGKSIPIEHRRLIIKTSLSNTRKVDGLNSNAGERNALMIEIGWICGLRVSDIITLKPRNFDFRLGRIEKRITKTNEILSLPVCSDLLLDKVKKYIEVNNILDDSFLFPSSQNDHMKSSTFTAMFEGVLTKAGLPTGQLNGYTPHDLRRTCATELFNNDVPLKTISLRLGHASVAMTENYLRLSERTEDVEKLTSAIGKVFDIGCVA